ncbi:uncharacterized protein LOC111314550 [Durio zibethinus]|uniref:Uncharacterized protein LOC111314550 n=1 Tax=Durio zibethinus TaxID=66656 RepID=A0A6P6B3V8_DURZI|nr:uncharacterized protein LOC111314550 [Durio zibethinus]
MHSYLDIIIFMVEKNIHRIPFSQANGLSFITPIMASVMARIVLHEKLKITEIRGGKSVIASLFHSSWHGAGGLLKVEEASNINFTGSQHLYAALIGFSSSITGGVGYCLIKAAAKASDQPVFFIWHSG